MTAVLERPAVEAACVPKNIIDPRTPEEAIVVLRAIDMLKEDYYQAANAEATGLRYQVGPLDRVRQAACDIKDVLIHLSMPETAQIPYDTDRVGEQIFGIDRYFGRTQEFKDGQEDQRDVYLNTLGNFLVGAYDFSSEQSTIAAEVLRGAPLDQYDRVIAEEIMHRYDMAGASTASVS